MSGALLGNGTYSLLVTEAGGGVSSWRDYTLAGWSPDPTEDNGGLLLYLRDLDDGEVWCAGDYPLRSGGELRRQPGRCTLACEAHEVAVAVDICVAPSDDVEIRRVALRNTSDRPRRIEITSYTEVVLCPPAAHAAHPGFAKLFVETEVEGESLLARRRPRSAGEHHPWLLHAMHALGTPAPEYETDRVRFLGRGRSLSRPLALASAAPLSGTVGKVLDPIFSLRRIVSLAPGASAELVVLLACAAERNAVLALAQRYADAAQVQAAFAGAAEQETTRLRDAGLEAGRGAELQSLALAMLRGDVHLRASDEILRRAEGSSLSLAADGLAGDGLLAVAVVDAEADLAAAADLRLAAAYWRSFGLRVRVAVLCGEEGLAARARAEGAVVLSRSEVDADVLLACAHLVVASAAPAARSAALECGAERRLGPLRWSTALRAEERAAMARRTPHASRLDSRSAFEHSFSATGDEYVLRVDPAADGLPPMPWINVVANEGFGFLVSERGAATTWSQNSRENRLTPWRNDPVCDPHDEALYLRDEKTGEFWSPLPGPCPAGSYEVRHGFGYSRFTHTSHELEQEVLLFVPREEPVKIARLRLTNRGDSERELSLFSYHRLVLGVLPEESGRFVVTGIDESSTALIARNLLNNEFAAAHVFATVVAAGTSLRFSGDRTSFLGAGGTVETPAAVLAGEIEERTGAGLDPCAAVQARLRIAAGETIECCVLLGEASNREAAIAMVEHFRVDGAVAEALAEVREFWRGTVSAVQVKTPSAAIDRMLNGWLLYQVLSCRLWGRSAFYQSGGAFGFRDQLQDSAALVFAHPEMTRHQIRLHAAHQFVEGDVLHWWHPPTGRGMRTRFADDLNWLPFITAFYVRTTGDAAVLDEPARFVTARALAPGEDEAYLLPLDSGEIDDVYAHCCRALDRSLTRGAHGLPLFGTGDWNDGMNRVGRDGRGESVWMAFFLHRVIDDFAPLCEHRGDGERVARYRAYQKDLEQALEVAAWDGEWYRRGYYDDGTPLGSKANTECRIDALAQAWAVISDAVPRGRAEEAMNSAERLLVDREAKLIRLLAPPFDRDPHDPGYIKGYVPGIRENGGQYTHAAVWMVEATAELGRRDRAAAYLEMLSPVSHTDSPERLAVYQVEPYVVVADVYGVEPHVGRGGWTWYTGSAGWMYRVGLGSILGLRLEGGESLCVKPCIPDEWPGFEVSLRLFGGEAVYEIEVRNPNGCSASVRSLEIDGAAIAVAAGAARIPVVRDGVLHKVVVVLGPA